MIKEFQTKHMYTGKSGVFEESKTPPITEKRIFSVARVMTGNHVRHQTGYSEPCLILDSVKFTRTDLLKMLVSMSEMELEETR